jgi:predicted TIM-barrel fold metal-dependent hydrolase
VRPRDASAMVSAFLAGGKADDCPIVDAHAHYGPYLAIYFPQNGKADAMLRAMDRARVRTAVLSGHAALVDPVRGNAEVAGVIKAHPDRFRGYLVVNPNYPDQTAQTLADFGGWQERGFVGFKLHPGMHQYSLTGPNYASVLAYANEHQVPLLSHTWGADGTCGTKQVREVVRRYPHLPFIAGHACYGDWDEAIALAAGHDNLYLELTAAYAVNGVIERIVAGAGSHKVLLGDDLPWFDPTYAIGCVLFARISDEDRRAILYRNATSLLGI